MSEEYYRSVLSKNLDYYFEYKKRGDIHNQIAALDNVINSLTYLERIAPYERRVDYTNQKTHSMEVRQNLVNSLQHGRSSNPYGYSILSMSKLGLASPAIQVTEPAFNSPSMQPQVYPAQPVKQPQNYLQPTSPRNQPQTYTQPTSPRKQLQTNSQPTSPIVEKKIRQSYIDRDLTENEKEILKSSSYFNGSECTLWLDSDASDFDRVPYVDNYDFHLSNEQHSRGCHFEEPNRVFQSPVVIKSSLDPFAVCQHRVADCTIISSIISCANYEVRFKKPVITGIIYPQKDGKPILNPYGKYFVKLWFNGIPRRVMIDHRILVTRDNIPISTYSRNEGELWPILIEKAFLKVHGGYSYNGGNGGQDTYSITGWIPESLVIQNETPEKQNEIWTRVSNAFNYGDCIVTSGTLNTLPPGTEEILGLAEGHCYCICRMETINGVRLLQLRNPWGSGSWKGAYSYNDRIHWNANLQSLCPNYQYRLQHPEYDDGLFWMEFSDFTKYFRSFNINWSSSLLNRSLTYHGRYCNILNGCSSDTRNMSECPQYSVEINNPTKGQVPVYIYLSRHYNYYDDLLGTEKRKFLITIQAYKTKKPFYMIRREEDTIAVEDEIVFTNIPYCLAKLRVDPGIHYYTIVILSLKETTASVNPFNFTVCARYHNSISVLMKPMFSVPDYHFMTRNAGAWTHENSGGRPSQPTYLSNPMYCLTLNQPTIIHAHLENKDSSQAMNIRLVREEDVQKHAITRNTMIIDSDAFIANVCSFEHTIAPGSYRIILSSFDTGYKGDYVLTLRSSHPVDLKEFQVIPRPLPGFESSMCNSYSLMAYVHLNGTGASVFGPRGFKDANYCRVYVKEVSNLTMKMTTSLGCIPIIAVFTSKNGQLPPAMLDTNVYVMSSKRETTSTTSLVCSLNPGYFYISYGLMHSNNGDVQLKIISNHPLHFFYSCLIK